MVMMARAVWASGKPAISEAILEGPEEPVFGLQPAARRGIQLEQREDDRSLIYGSLFPSHHRIAADWLCRLL
jgi:hypothetical protein